MKAYKSIDFYLQIFCLLMTGVAILIDDAEKINPLIFIIAFIIVQLTSIILHFFTGPQTWKKKNWRKYHLIGLGLVVVMVIIAMFQDAAGRSGDKDDKYGMPGLSTIVWATIPAILTSLFYIIITWREWMNIKQRSLTQLK